MHILTSAHDVIAENGIYCTKARNADKVYFSTFPGADQKSANIFSRVQIRSFFHMYSILSSFFFCSPVVVCIPVAFVVAGIHGAACDQNMLHKSNVHVMQFRSFRNNFILFITLRFSFFLPRFSALIRRRRRRHCCSFFSLQRVIRARLELECMWFPLHSHNRSTFRSQFFSAHIFRTNERENCRN